MKVMKFGGTSVGTAESLLNVKHIVESCTEPVMVVVSALGGVTNQLLSMCDQALAHDPAYETMLQQVRERHTTIISQVVPPERQQACHATVTQFFDRSLLPLLGMLDMNRDLTADAVALLRDGIVSHGEVLSSAIVSYMIDDAEPHFSPNFVKTVTQPDGTYALDAELTDRLIKQEFASCNARRVVMQGFIAQDRDSDLKTNLGRGGSDFTAALVAAALDADCLEIWTDVDGFMTADPRTHPDATVIDEMTYEQAQAMCDAGAKVIYPPTIKPVAEKGIPVWVKNTFNPSARGTIIK